MKKNILILTPFYLPNIGGAETFANELCNEASKWNHVTVLTFQPLKQTAKNCEEYYYKEGFLKVYRMKWLIKQSQSWKGVGLKNALSVMPLMVLNAILLFVKNKYDIIHSQGLLSGLVGVFLKKLFKRKLFLTLLALYEFEKWSGIRLWIAKFILNNCDIIFVEGKNGKKDIESISNENKIRIFQHWANQDVFYPPRERRRDKIVILFVGRPIPEKGRHIIEEAEVILNDPKYEFIYVENISQSELAKIYQMAHIVVVPSLYAEGFSRVVAEAASCGCALITSNRGSLPEMIIPIQGNWCIEPTPEKFAQAIINLSTINNKQGEKAGIMAKKYFSVKNAEVFLNEYLSV